MHDLSVTTNGFLLERDAEALVGAGINRFNVSVDSLQRDRFFELTRRDALPQVLAGSSASRSSPRRTRSRSTRSRSEGSPKTRRSRSPSFARRTPYEVRFIEFMPLDADHAWNDDQVLTGAEIRDAIDAVYRSSPAPRAQRHRQRLPLRRRPGRIGFINPVSEPFCSDCNRVRLTADGRLRTCLFSLTRPTCAARCATAPTTTSSCRSSVTPSGARSSSTTSASPASSSPRGACRRSAAGPRRRRAS